MNIFSRGAALLGTGLSFFAAPAHADSLSERPAFETYMVLNSATDMVALDIGGAKVALANRSLSLQMGLERDLGAVSLALETEVGIQGPRVAGRNLLRGGDSASIAVDRDRYAGIRLGVPVNPSIQLFGKVGRLTSRLSRSYDNGAKGGWSDHVRLSGTRFSLGSATRYKGSVITVEYRVVRYDDFRFPGNDNRVKAMRGQTAIGLVQSF